MLRILCEIFLMMYEVKKNFKKYVYVARAMWDEMLTYRLNFSMWRVRNVLQLLTVYFLWFALIPKGSSFGAYNQTQMLTYILGTAIVGAIVFSTRTGTIGDQINTGELSNFLLRPINIFAYWFARDVGDKAMNIAFSLGELTILFFILRPPLFVQTHIFLLLASLLSLILGIFIYFYFSLLLGFIGFWNSETWAPRFIFLTILSFFSGGFFPLDILPKPLYAIAVSLPFTYMVYSPIKIYLGQIPLLSIIGELTGSLLWASILYVVAKFVWLKGLKNYAAQGR